MKDTGKLSEGNNWGYLKRNAVGQWFEKRKKSAKKKKRAKKESLVDDEAEEEGDDEENPGEGDPGSSSVSEDETEDDDRTPQDEDETKLLQAQQAQAKTAEGQQVSSVWVKKLVNISKRKHMSLKDERILAEKIRMEDRQYYDMRRTFKGIKKE